MLAHEVLQSFPTQKKAMLLVIGAVDPACENIIGFDLDLHVSRLPPQLAFQIQFVLSENTIFCTIIDDVRTRDGAYKILP